MADKSFTVKDILKELDIELNLPPFLHQKKYKREGKLHPFVYM